MLSDIFRLFFYFVRDLPAFALTALQQRIAAQFHHYTYIPSPRSQTKNVVVIGGSFAGYQAAKRLTETLPTGYRVVLVEKNSHFNYVFAFPRFSVVKGFEHYAFIPYTGPSKRAPKGIFEIVQGTVVRVDERVVQLDGGETLEYEYMVIATGTASPLPSKVAATDSLNAQRELRRLQDRIDKAERIAVVGGGAVGVELACDIKDFYPEKNVVLFHSRDRLLPRFGRRLHEYVIGRFEELGVEICLNERPKMDGISQSLTLLNGVEKIFDLIIPSTGQHPNSSLLSTLSPASISRETSHILVHPTLQIIDDRFPRVFAAGDVAATGGPKMARAGFMQSNVLAQNILTLIKGSGNLESYKPLMWLEGSLILTLGKSRSVMYTKEDTGQEILIPLNLGKVDMSVKRQWKFFGADVGKVQIANK